MSKKTTRTNTGVGIAAREAAIAEAGGSGSLSEVLFDSEL